MCRAIVAQARPLGNGYDLWKILPNRACRRFGA
jgi:hypothetical protein